MFYLSGVGLAFFLNILLLSKQDKTLADKVLSVWLVVIMLHLLLFSLFTMRLYPVVWGVEIPMPILHGPLLYLYTLALTRNKISLREWSLHLALPSSFYVYLIPFLASSGDHKAYVYANDGIGHETFMTIRAFCIPISGFLYVVLSSIALRNHRRSIVNQFSSIERINLMWLQYLILWILAIWILVLFHNDQLIFGATVIFIFFIGYFGIRQVGIFSTTKNILESTNEVVEEIVQVSETESRVKYQKSGLTQESSESLHAHLMAVMSESKVYCECDISLGELAKRLGVPANHLSQVINEREGKSFFDFVNNYRVQEFIQVASAPESRKLTLQAIAQQCGFNSKSSFNRYFKKVTGQSPSEYFKEQ